MRPLFNNLYAPADSGSGSGSSNNSSDEPEQLSFDFLNDDTDELGDKEPPLELPKDKEVDDEDDDKDTEDEEVDELKEIEDELKEPTEEDLELTTPVRRREILKKYPQLFKDFPYLEKAYYREQQFTELLPTINDAKVAVEKAQVLDTMERSIMSGDLSTVLRAAKQESEDSFLKIADNYLPALKRVDQQAYYHVLGNVVKDTIITMVKEARNLGDQGAPLQAAANVLNQFVFGSQNFTPPRNLSKQDNPEDKSRQERIKAEDTQRVMGRFEAVKDELQTKADNTLKSTIDQHIDPKGTMTDYVKKNATRESKEMLESLMAKDTRFRSLLDKLWEKAFEKNFDKESTDRIKSAYLSKAKTLLPSVIKKARNDALKGLGRRASEDVEEIELTPKKSPSVSGKSTSPSSGKIRKASDIPKGMSTLDVLNS